MGMRSATLQDIAKDVLSAGVVCLTGGKDIANTPLLVFPAHAQSHLELWNSDRLLQVLRHYLQWLEVTSQVRAVACLANMRNASKTVISVIVEAVEKLELSARGSVSALYFLKPNNQTKSRLLKKMLGLRPSKKHPKIPLFKVILMKNVQDVFTHIDLCHLTFEFGGTLDYDHEAWIKFHQVVALNIKGAQAVLKKAPDLREKLELLHEYDPHNQTAQDIQVRLSELTETFHHSIKEAGFQSSLDRCKQTLLTLDTALQQQQQQQDEDLQPGKTQQPQQTQSQTNDAKALTLQASTLERVPAEHVHKAAECLRDLYNKLSKQRGQLEELWRSIESAITVHLQIQKHRERAIEMEKRLTTQYQPLLKDHPCVGKTLSQAELYRTHFTTTLYEPAKELLSQATELLEDVQRLRERTSPPSDVTDILRTLTVALQPFTQQLQTLQDVYVAVHIFHLLFQKALMWYRKVLRFLPEGLQKLAEEASVSSSSAQRLIQMPMEWQVTVQSFMNKHPPPGEQHLARLDTHVPQQVEKRLRVQARSLALRLRLLHRIVCSPRLPANLLLTVFRWRAEVKGSNNNSNTSSAQHSQPDQNEEPLLGTRNVPFPGEESMEVHRLLSKNEGGLFPSDRGMIDERIPSKSSRAADYHQTASSFSSSDAGDLDYAHMNLLDHTGFSLARDLPYNSDHDDTDPSSASCWTSRMEREGHAKEEFQLQRRSDGGMRNKMEKGRQFLQTHHATEHLHQTKNQPERGTEVYRNKDVKQDVAIARSVQRKSENPAVFCENSVKNSAYIEPDLYPEGDIQYRKAPPTDIQITHRGRTYGEEQTNEMKQEKLEGQQQPWGEKSHEQKERFIRLTFSPTNSNHFPASKNGKSKRRRKSKDSWKSTLNGSPGTLLVDDRLHSHIDQDEAFFCRYQDAATGSESGIDLSDVHDVDHTWDEVINSIRAVTSSSLPTEVKIQRMTHLLSRSTARLASEARNIQQSETTSAGLRSVERSAVAVSCYDLNGSEARGGNGLLDESGYRGSLGSLKDLEMNEFGVLCQRAPSYDYLGPNRQPTRTWDFNKPGSSLGGFYQFRDRVSSPQRNHSFAIARDFEVTRVDREASTRRLENCIHVTSPAKIASGNKINEDPSRRRSNGQQGRETECREQQSDLFSGPDDERPARAVARLRQQLAKSLMDLDSPDNGEDLRGSARNISQLRNSRQAAAPSAQFESSHRCVGNSADSSIQALRWQRSERQKANDYDVLPGTTQPGEELLSRSADNGLNSLHLRTAAQPSSQTTESPLLSWRSVGDGLDSASPNNSRRPPAKVIGSFAKKMLLGDEGGEARAQFLPVPAPRYLKQQTRRQADQEQPGDQPSEPFPAAGHRRSERTPAGKSPSRWRQGILDGDSGLLGPSAEPAPSLGKAHQKTNHFIAPSFLKPFHSVHDLRSRAGLSRPLTVADDQDRRSKRLPRTSTGLQGSEPSSQLRTSEPPIFILSNDADQAFSSHDNDESSLKRSRRILKEAEERLQRRAGQKRTSQVDNIKHHLAELIGLADDSQQMAKTVQMPPNSSGSEIQIKPDADCGSHHQLPVRTAKDDLGEMKGRAWENYGPAFASLEPPETTSADSAVASTEVDWDADVSNISDVVYPYPGRL